MNLIALLSFFTTIALYWAAKCFHKRRPRTYFSPLVTVPALVAAVLLTAQIPYEAYNAGTRWLNLMLQPATIAFAVPLYKYRGLLKKHAVEIIPGVFFGSITAMVSSLWLAEGLHIDKQLAVSFVPHSVTTPIAMDISQLIGGVPSVSAAMVIMTGILGPAIGPSVIRCLKIESEIARGVLLGASTHAVGTARAFQFSATTGAVASLSMILAAIITLSTVKPVMNFIASM